jgi:ADP-ribosylglycohydrolase
MLDSPEGKATFNIVDGDDKRVISADDYYNRLKGSFIAGLSANFTGLGQGGLGKYYEAAYTTLREGGPDSDFPVNRPDILAYRSDATNGLGVRVWRTDDDGDIEWTAMHILCKYGLNSVTPAIIRTEWMTHINRSIWVATARARELMNSGLVPPQTGSLPDNQYYDSIDAQIQCEIFGQMSPGMSDAADARAEFWAQVTNSGEAVNAAKFYARMQAEAFFCGDKRKLVRDAKNAFSSSTRLYKLVTNVENWSAQYSDWRDCRALIYDNYHETFYMSKVNLACTVMALLYGDGDLTETVRIAALAGYDADCNMTTAAGIVGASIGFQNLPIDLTSRLPAPADGLDYKNTTRDIDPGEDPYDRTGVSLLAYDQVAHALGAPGPHYDICARIQGLAEQNIIAEGGTVASGVYHISYN